MSRFHPATLARTSALKPFLPATITRTAVMLLAVTACAERSLVPPAPPPKPPLVTSRSRPKQELARDEIPVVKLADPASRTVALRFVFQTGSSDDPSGQEGVMRLAAQLMAEGGTAELSAADLARRLFPMAASVGVEVDRDQTVFFTEAVKEDIERLYPIFRDVLLAPRLAEGDFERLREQAVSRLENDLRGSDDESLAKEALASFVWKDHPYGHPPLGSVSALKRLGLDQVKTARELGFCASRLTVGIAGSFSEQMLNGVLDDMKKLPAHCAERAVLPAAGTPSQLEVLIVDKPNAESTAISIGAPLDLRRGDTDYPAVRLATDYLGLHRTSAGVLFHELRELRGLNYGDYAYSEHFEQEGWDRFARPNLVRREQDFSLWIRPVKPDKAIFALRGALYFLNRLTTSAIEQVSLDQSRTFLSGYLGLETQTPMRQLGYALDDHAYGLPVPYAHYLRAQWMPLHPADLQAAVSRHISPEHLKVAVVSKDGARLAAALVAGAPSPITYASPKPHEVTAEDRLIQRYPLGLNKTTVQVVSVKSLFR